ncbi:MAG: NnrU family protein [Cyanobacteria bacterium P01_H01_bin.15]
MSVSDGVEFASQIASHAIMLGLLLGFAIAHSGLAALRSRGEKIIGARGYRVLFALVSIPFAAILIVYFFNHRYDGLQLWQWQAVPGVKLTVWILSLISFIFLYPATFNLLEIAALQKPEIHLYETGIIRISRHPQMVGQVIWCVAHALWLGTSFMLVTCFGLIAHHLFAVWHGDRRWQHKYGDAFEKVKERTSIVPFAAVLDGRQTLQWKEFIRPAYLGVLGFVLLFWWGHPWLMIVTARVPW